MHPILVQTLAYSGVMIISILLVSFLLKGFFWKYVKVRMSFGKSILVKIRNKLRDYYQVGKVEEGFLVYKDKGYKKRISLSKVEGNPFYKSSAVLWIDVDEEKNAVCLPDYTTVTGYDAIKFDDLLKRALMRPTEQSKLEKIMLIMIGLAILAGLAAAYLSYTNMSEIQALKATVGTMARQASQTIVGSGAI